MPLTKVEAEALDKLTDKWQSAKKLQERLTTLNMLVSAGLAERHYNPDSHFTENVRTKYKLSQETGLCENDVIGVLANSFPEWTWVVQQDNLVFAIMAKTIVKRVIVSYTLDAPRADLRTDADIKRVGREAIAGLKDALQRHERGTDGKNQGNCGNAS